MFLKTAMLKKLMKNSLKGAGLAVGDVNDQYLVYGIGWGMQTNKCFASAKFKAAIVELIGDLPSPGDCFLNTIDPETGDVVQQSEVTRDPYEMWKSARGQAFRTGLIVKLFPHDYSIFQEKENGVMMIMDSRYCEDIISPSELESGAEEMPSTISITPYGDALIWKNDTTIYWAEVEQAPEKIRKQLFPLIQGIDFQNKKWEMRVNGGTVDNEDNEEPEYLF